MKFLPLVWANLKRRKLRTLFTFLSILVAFVLFGYISAINLAFRMGVDVAGADRLVLRHKVSIIQLLPEAYQARIERIPGVVDVSHQTWFGGVYQDPKNFFMQCPIEPERFFRIYPEFVVPDDQMQAFVRNRTGAVVGRAIADRFGWKVGDRVPLQATIWTKKDGSRTWEFDIEGIYDGAHDGVDETQFLFHYEYFDESRQYGEGEVGWYIVRIDDPDNAVAIADAIDAEFANSFAETETSTEKAFMQAWAKQVGDIGFIAVAILSAVFFTILVVAGNTMAQSVRERTGELAVLKTLGFTNRRVLLLVLLESCILALVGGGLGLLLATWWISLGDPTHGALPLFAFRPRDQVIGWVLVLLLGLATGILPAVQAMRLRIVDALRRV
jgi:putative ABC transport system permease protein